MKAIRIAASRAYHGYFYTASPALDPSEIRETIQEGRNFLNAAKDYLDREDTGDRETPPEGG